MSEPRAKLTSWLLHAGSHRSSPFTTSTRRWSSTRGWASPSGGIPGGGYGFATRDGIELHLGVAPDGDNRTSSAYLFVDDADELAAAWRAAGIEVHTPEDTEWGQHEGAVVDRDGNVIRFGSPIGEAGEQ